jgi:FkbM family methyltransferase
MVITQQVSVTKLATLLSKHNIKNIDYLKVDTEGHDCVILNNFLDESLIRPMAIKFESNILQDKNDVQNLVSRLQKIGYSITYDCDNVIAILISL